MHQAGVTLNWKLETCLKKFPVMLKKFTRTRDDPLDAKDKDVASSSCGLSTATGLSVQNENLEVSDTQPEDPSVKLYLNFEFYLVELILMCYIFLLV